jgi:hypothetical protein
MNEEEKNLTGGREDTVANQRASNFLKL